MKLFPSLHACSLVCSQRSKLLSFPASLDDAIDEDRTWYLSIILGRPLDEKAPNICDDAAFKKNIKLVLETSHPGRKIEHILYFFKKNR